MCAAITSSLLATGVSGYMAYQGAQDKKNAKKELNEYERQTLDNAFENIPVNTLATDYMRENTQRDSANLVDFAQQSGTRGVFGALPKIQGYTNNANREQQIYLDQKLDKRNYLAASDDQQIRSMTENRDLANIGALSSQVDAGNQDMWNGITGMMKALSMRTPSKKEESENGEEYEDWFGEQAESVPSTIGYKPFSNFKF